MKSELIELELGEKELLNLVDFYLKNRTSAITIEHIQTKYYEITEDNIQDVCFDIIINEATNHVLKSYLDTLESDESAPHEPPLDSNYDLPRIEDTYIENTETLENDA